MYPSGIENTASGMIFTDNIDDHPGIDWPGGLLDFAAQGEFNGGTIKIQWSLGGANWTDLAGHNLTDNGRVGGEALPSGYKVRPHLSEATNPNLLVSIKRVAAIKLGSLNG